MRATAPPRRSPYLLGAVLTVAAFVAVYIFFVRTHMGQVVDERAFAGAVAWRGGLEGAAEWFLRALPTLSLGIGAVIVVAIVAVRHNGKVLVAAVAAALAANASTQLLKYAVLDRPNTGVDSGLANSLPSGHTTAAASAALAVFLVCSPRLRPLVALIGGVFATVTGAATLVNQWHRPSDVIAALLVVAFWGCAAGFVLAPTSEARTGTPREGASLWLGVLATSCGVVAAYGFVVTVKGAGTQDAHLFTAYAGGVAAIAAVSLGLAWLAVVVFRWLR